MYKDMQGTGTQGTGTQGTGTQGTKTQAFGAYFQCYRSPMATYKCLETFRRHYPTATVVLLSDNGYNYAKMAEHFGCIYLHNHENKHLRTLVEGDYRQSAYTLLENIKKAFQLIPEEYVMWLEDDVTINAPITDRFRYDINGYCPNVYSVETMYSLSKTYPIKNRNYRWSGHGGSVYHKNKLISSMENKTILDDVLVNWVQYKLTADICHDFLLSLLVNLQDGTIGPYEGHTDEHRGLNPSIKVQHQYKAWYNTPLPPELVHLIE